MRIFNRDSKINFVDDNNVFVGFDYSQCCCESFGYWITRSIPQRPAGDAYKDKWEFSPETVPDEAAAGFNFDTAFRLDLSNDQVYMQDGGAVCFRLVNGSDELFLTLHNNHNGYYSHGFEMKNGEQVITEGSL